MALQADHTPTPPNRPLNGGPDRPPPQKSGNHGPIPSRTAPGPSQTFTEPPSRPNRFVVWLFLLLCLALTCPALLINLDQSDVVSSSEAEALAISTQTWFRQSQFTGANAFLFEPFVPHLNEEPQLQQPPGMYWLHMTAFAVPKSKTNLSVDRQVLRARVVSVVVTLLTVASVYWAGLSIGGTLTGLFAALVCIANPVFMYYSRTASAPIYHTGLLAISTAAALWALRPLKPSPSLARQAIGWACCGVVLGIALLVAGPTVLPQMCVPILLILALCPHRINHTMGLLAALLIGVLIALPWAAYVQGWAPDIWTQWIGELTPQWPNKSEAIYKTIGMCAVFALIVTLPWTLWLIGAIVQPFSVSSAGSRTRLFLGWVWFASMATMLILFSDADQVGKVLVIIPAFSVLIGQLFHQYTDLAAQARYARFWQLLRWPHAAVLALASVVLPVFLYAQSKFVERGWLPRPLTDDLGWVIILGLGITLSLTAALSIRWAIKQHPSRVLACWAAWVLVLAWILVVPVTRGPIMHNPVRDDAKKLAKLVTTWPVYWARDSITDTSHPDPALVLYFGRPIPTVTPQQIDTTDLEQDRYFVLSKGAPVKNLTRFELAAHLPQTGVDVWRNAR